MMGAGMRTWLNVAVLAFSFVIIIFYNGLIDGWNQEARRDTINWEIGGGQLWHNAYDPFDPFTLQDAHGIEPQGFTSNGAVPILIIQGSAYPNGHLLPVLIKGILTNQQVLQLPTTPLSKNSDAMPALIGKRMAKASKLKKGDRMLMRWRDKNGTFDAREIEITDIFDSNVPSIDQGQIWIALENLRDMTGLTNEATLFVLPKEAKPQAATGWTFKNHDFLLADMDAIIQSKKGSGYIIYMLLLTIALLAIFDTQVLSIFRRQREIGTFIALGMTRGQVISLFTMEGGFISLLAAAVGLVVGFPIFAYLVKTGIGMPAYSNDMGIVMGSRIYPAFGIGLVVSTIFLVVISATIVSYMPTRKIAKMNTTDALKGKLQ